MKTRHPFNPLLLIFPLFAFCSDSQQNHSAANGPQNYRAKAAFPELSFRRPVDLQYAPDNSNRLFVVEQSGIISVFNNDPSATSKKTFLDITDRVDDSGNEEGLLGLAFHPEYKSNGYFYVNYTASGPDRTVISRFKVSATDPDKADVTSEQEILSFRQPYSNHNGGQVSFGPDGFLYIAVGDGGSGGDPQGNGQNLKTLLGSILRIDIDQQKNGKQYAIPADNPFAGNKQGFREEIYAYGLRNPWRFSFDHETGRLWAGDVGQNAWEEINVIEKGGNYGWNTMEGNHCFEPSKGCDRTGLKLPIHEYGRDQGISVTGGFVYHGPSLSDLKGKYIYADFGTRRIWALDHSRMANPVNTLLFEADFNISSFGVDQHGELYLCAFDNRIYRITED